jgi:hypothetical protein
MKRHSIAFLIHPYKNSLVPKGTFREAVNAFAQTVLDIGASYQNIRLNLVMPGYFLEALDPMLLLQLREMHKKGAIEWLTTGYTEPFLSFSPQWLVNENLRHGITSFQEYAGSKPAGFVPPFSNWEPSYIDVLTDAGIQYNVLSRSLLASQYRSKLGYWVTEFAGSSTVLFPVHSVYPSTVAGTMETWIQDQFAADPGGSVPVKLLCIDFLCPLLTQDMSVTQQGLKEAAAVFDRLLLTYQPIRFTEFLSSNPPLGLMYLPQSLVLRRDDSDTAPHFLNYLHSFDQVGVIQRKLMDIADNIGSRRDSKHVEPHKKTLFFVADINRYIPSKSSGFTRLHDRMWCYEKLIGVEQELRERDNISGGQIRIADFLRNGGKSIIMTNKNLAVYVDHRNGGSVFEIDFRRRRYNVCAGYNPSRHALPMVIESGLSYTMFVDHLVDTATQASQFRAKTAAELGDFYCGAYDYKIKKTADGIKASLHRQGSLVQGDKNCPLSMEKMLGLEKDHPAIPFVYQITNNSLTPYLFRLAVELTISLPGIATDSAYLLNNRQKIMELRTGLVELPQVTQWVVADPSCGVMVVCSLQKPVDVWCYPAVPPGVDPQQAEALTIVITAPITLDGSGMWSLLGKLQFKRVALAGKQPDEI